jgi:hypothetical protein
VKNLFQPERVAEVKSRLATLRPDSRAEWGKMTVTQMVAHCSVGIESATGDRQIKRVPIGYLLGPLVRGLALGDDKPMKKNSPTARDFIISGERDLDTERSRLTGLIDKFASGGPAKCTTHPHAFFGKLTAEQWAILMYKHLDHHLRQFGVP